MLLHVELNEKLYLRNPQDTELGRRMLTESVALMDELGLERFTFKKLAQRMESTEASLYRYFENKHRLLAYLTSWYWACLGYQIRYHTHNVPDATQRLQLTLSILAKMHLDNPATTTLDEAALYRVVLNEASKAYLTRGVDQDNQAGLFREYKYLVADIASTVSEVNPTYPHPNALVSTLLEAACKQIFFAQHLPDLTDTDDQTAIEKNLYSFLENLVFGVLK